MGVTGEADAARVAAARSGDRKALDAVVAQCLPLVYNIVRRTLPLDADVDDIVQETMVRVVRGIGGLREPDRFRSWLVAITMNQVREHRRRSSTAATPLEECDERPDPNAEFVDRALTRLDVSRQRREVQQAALWLHEEDRELLSLWSLECGGHLARADVTSALRLNAHHVTVKVGRLKNRLEAARMLVRAFSIAPRCPRLAEAASDWPGEPNPLWRKRFLRHVDTCRRCRGMASDLVPVERLLMGMGLAALPAGYVVFVLSHLPGASSSAATAQFSRLADGAARQAAQPAGLYQRIADVVVTKPVLVPVGVSALCASVLAAVILIPGSPTSVQTVAGASDSPVGASSTQTSGTNPSATTSGPAPTTTTSTTTAASSSAPAPHTTTAPPPKAQPHVVTPAPTSAAPSSPADRVLALMNQARAAAGLPPYRMDTGLIGSATAHNQAMAGGCGLSHQCTGEAAIGDRETAAGVHWGTCGENIGDGGPVGNSTDPIAQMALGLTQGMLDEKPPNDGHRQNILSSSFTRVGIVVSRDASGTVWMTQDFAD